MGEIQLHIYVANLKVGPLKFLNQWRISYAQLYVYNMLKA